MSISATISGKMRILAEGDPIIEKIIAENPVLRAVHGSANGKIAVMDALSIGQEGHPRSPDGVKDLAGITRAARHGWDGLLGGFVNDIVE